MVKAVAARNPRPEIKYEVADGSHIPNLGEKSFRAYTNDGVRKKMTAQVTEVNKALLSVSRLLDTGHRIVFDARNNGGSYIENCTSGDWIALEENNGTYVLKLWVHKDQSSPF